MYFNDMVSLQWSNSEKYSQGVNGFINEHIIPRGNPTGKRTPVDQTQHPKGEKSKAPEYRRPGQKIEYPSSSRGADVGEGRGSQDEQPYNCSTTEFTESWGRNGRPTSSENSNAGMLMQTRKCRKNREGTERTQGTKMKQHIIIAI